MTIYAKEAIEPPARPGVEIGVKDYDVLEHDGGALTLRYRKVPRFTVRRAPEERQRTMHHLKRAAEYDAEVRKLYDAEGRLASQGLRSDAAKVAGLRIRFREAYELALREAMGIRAASVLERRGR